MKCARILSPLGSTGRRVLAAGGAITRPGGCQRATPSWPREPF